MATDQENIFHILGESNFLEKGTGQGLHITGGGSKMVIRDKGKDLSSKGSAKEEASLLAGLSRRKEYEKLKLSQQEDFSTAKRRCTTH